MDEAYVFPPSRSQGTLFLGGGITLIILFNLWNLFQIAVSPVDARLLINLILALLAPLPLPWFIYRLRALQRAEYLIARDGIRLSWGMRLEDIPVQHVLWLRPRAEDPAELTYPRLRVPGALLGMGSRRLADGSTAEVPVEFIAAGGEDLILLATPERVFAISPANPGAFLTTFAEMTQFGSLNPIAPQSVYPSFWSRRALRSRAMRLLLVAALALNLVLIGAVAIAVQQNLTVFMPTSNPGLPAEAVPSQNLWILPFINTLLSAVEWAGGFFLYREEKNRPTAYVLWGCNLFSSALFLAGLYFILHT